MNITIKTRIGFAIFDIVIVIMASLLALLLKSHTFTQIFEPDYYQPFVAFVIIWIGVSFLFNKYRFGRKDNLRSQLKFIFVSNFIILSTVTIAIFFLDLESISRFIIIGTIIIGTFAESLVTMTYIAVLQSPFLQEWIGGNESIGLPNGNRTNGNGNGLGNGLHKTKTEEAFLNILAVNRNNNVLRKAIIEETNEIVYQWIKSLTDLTSRQTLVIATITRFNVDNLDDNFYKTIVNLTRINDIQRINKFFESVNAKLPMGGTFIGCGETYQLRKEKILGQYPSGLNYVIYSFDFLIKRVFPKLKITRKLYFLFSRGKNRVISRTETLGRLYSCGFEVMVEKRIDNLLYWMVKKVKEPAFDDHPTYGVLIRLRRIGKNGKEFNVFKLRTMHAYSEYVQHYVYQNNQLDDGGKFKDDFRVTTLGRFFRKFWLDELPMLWNVMKGQMKIVGVRPLSKHYLGLYEPEMQALRLNHKPGLIPPYYGQFPPPVTIEDVQKNEKEYLLAYEKHPLKTDTVYFFKAFYNIFVKRARSK